MSKNNNTEIVYQNNSLADFISNQDESIAEFNLNINSKMRKAHIDSSQNDNNNLQQLNQKSMIFSLLDTPQFFEQPQQQQNISQFNQIESQQHNQVSQDEILYQNQQKQQQQQSQKDNFNNNNTHSYNNQDNVIENIQDQNRKKQCSIQEQIKQQQPLNQSSLNPPISKNTSQDNEDFQLKNQKVIHFFQKACELQKKMNIINNIQKFCNLMIGQLNSRRLQQLDEEHFYIIGDQSYYITPTKQNHMLLRKAIVQGKRLTHYLNFMLKIPVLQPSSLAIIISDILLFFILIYHIALFPLNISFDISIDSFHYIMTILSYVLFSIKIFLSFNTGFFEDGVIITNRAIILKHYLQEQFLIDFICLVAIYLENKWLNSIYIFQINFLKKIIDSLDEYFMLQQRFSIACQLTKLLLLIATVGHFCACGFCLITQFTDEREFNWMTKQEIQTGIWQIKYLYALYFSFITMTTIGYGDISPITVKEKIYVIIMTQIACGIFAYAINTIGQIFQEIANREARFKQAKSEVTNYMRQRNISKQLQFKVLKYLQYAYNIENEGGFPQKGEQVLNTISLNIRSEVYQEFFGSILMNSKIFGQNFSHKFLLKLSYYMKEMTISPGEDLYKKGDQVKSIYFIIKGVLEEYVEIGINEKALVLGQIKQGEFVGTTCFFTGSCQNISTRSKNIVHLAYINFEDFVTLIKQFPIDNEKFCMMRERFLFKSMQSLRKCQSCNNFGHQILHCPLLNYKPDINLIIKRHNYSQEQNRAKYKRNNKRKKINAILHSNLIRAKLINIRNNMILEFSKSSYPILPFLNAEPANDKDFFVNTPLLKQNDEGLYEIQSEDSVYSDFDLQEELQSSNHELSIVEEDIEEIKQLNNRSSYGSYKTIDNLCDQSLQQNKILELQNSFVAQDSSSRKSNSSISSPTKLTNKKALLFKQFQTQDIKLVKEDQPGNEENKSNNFKILEQQISQKIEDLNRCFSSSLSINQQQVTLKNQDILDQFDKIANFMYFMPQNNFNNIFKKERKKITVKRNAQKLLGKNRKSKKSIFTFQNQQRKNSKRTPNLNQQQSEDKDFSNSFQHIQIQDSVLGSNHSGGLKKSEQKIQ